MNITAVEMISNLSDYTIKGLAPLEIHRNISIALQNTKDYNWNNSFGEKGYIPTRMNLLSYAKQNGFEKALKAAADEYADFISKHASQHSESYEIAVKIAASHGLQDVEIELKEN